MDNKKSSNKINVDELLKRKRSEVEQINAQSNQTLEQADKFVESEAKKAGYARLENEARARFEMASMNGQIDGIKKFHSDLGKFLGAIQQSNLEEQARLVEESDSRLIESSKPKEQLSLESTIDFSLYSFTPSDAIEVPILPSSPPSENKPQLETEVNSKLKGLL